MRFLFAARTAAVGLVSFLLAVAAVAQTPQTTQTTPRKPLPFTGVNLAVAEFGQKKPGIPLVYGKDYTYPHENEVNYFASKGMNVFRIPFHWAALQATPRGELVPEELARLRSSVEMITRKGLVAILDPHNYARYEGKIIGSAEFPAENFAFFWERVAGEFKDNPHVWFGLMNEPHDMPTQQWLDAANTAIAAIRRTGAKNLILVPGNHWTGAHSWVSSDNDDLMLKIQDPANRYLYEVHQYLDADSSGTKPQVVSPTIGADRLRTFTDWCRKNKKRAFLGEFGVAASEEGRVAIENMLTAMERDRDVWVGFTWWAAGPWWGDYMFSIEPKDLQDRPQMRYLLPHLQPVNLAPAPRPTDPKLP